MLKDMLLGCENFSTRKGLIFCLQVSKSSSAFKQKTVNNLPGKAELSTHCKRLYFKSKPKEFLLHIL